MYSDYFLEYASYVILERAVPHLDDGLKPVQRRILHAMHEMEDGRFNKVANIVGDTMKYHPHGDAAIADAIVPLGQKELLLENEPRGVRLEYRVLGMNCGGQGSPSNVAAALL